MPHKEAIQSYEGVAFINNYIPETQYIILDGSLRKTKPEATLEASFERFGIPYTPQKSIAGTVLVDIFLEPNICVFVDGDYWHNYPLGLDKDKRQTELLESWGYKVFRFWEHDILNNPDLITQKLIEENNIKINNNLEEYFN
jgi:very-short-patch-repair endonuclease